MTIVVKILCHRAQQLDGVFYVVGSAPLQQSGFCQQIVLFVSNMRQLLVGAGMQSEFGNFFLLYVQIQRFKPSKFEAAVECLAAEMQSSVHWGGEFIGHYPRLHLLKGSG